MKKFLSTTLLRKHELKAFERSGRCDIPVFALHKMWHVGLFDNEHTQGSYEGNCLSVSWCPETWREIARLGGRQTWCLSRKGDTPGLFLDMLQLRESCKPLQRVILDWAVESHYITRQALYRSYTTDEGGGECYSTHLTLEEANLESESYLDEEMGSRKKPTKHRGFASTEKLTHLFNCDSNLGDIAEDFAIMAWAQHIGFDGVWWTEDYNPNYLSAPRGAIFKDLVRAWERKIDADTEEVLNNFPKTKYISLSYPSLT